MAPCKSKFPLILFVDTPLSHPLLQEIWQWLWCTSFFLSKIPFPPIHIYPSSSHWSQTLQISEETIMVPEVLEVCFYMYMLLLSNVLVFAHHSCDLIELMIVICRKLEWWSYKSVWTVMVVFRKSRRQCTTLMVLFLSMHTCN